MDRPTTSDQLAYQRRRRIADALIQGGFSQEPITHPLQGLARMAQTWAGMKMADRADQEQRDRDSAVAAELSKAFQPQTMPDAGVAGPRAGTGTTVQPDLNSVTSALMGSQYDEVRKRGAAIQDELLKSRLKTNEYRAQKSVDLEMLPQIDAAKIRATMPFDIQKAGGVAAAEAGARLPYQQTLDTFQTNNRIRADRSGLMNVAPGGSVFDPLAGGAPPMPQPAPMPTMGPQPGQPAPAGAPMMPPASPPMPNAAGAPPAPAPGVLFRAPPSEADQRKAAEEEKAKGDAVVALERQLRTARSLMGNPNTPEGRQQIAARERGTGTSSMFNFVPGTRGKDFDANLEAFKSQSFLPAVQALRGMGALSEKEGDRLTSAIGALDPGMTEEAFQASLSQIIKDLEAAYAKTPAGRAAASGSGATGEWSIEVVN